MTKRSAPLVEVWGLEELNPNSSRLKLFDFSQKLDGSLWAYPVFTTRVAALAFANFLTEDEKGPDAERFRQVTRECIRQIQPREIPRASKVMVDCTALRDPGDNTASVMMLWGAFYDGLAAELN